MAYTTKEAVRAATGFTDDTKILDATITAYIADADSVINAKIADRYQVPLASTPDVIEMISRHITTGLLYANEYGEETEDTDKGWKGRLDYAMGLLDDIQSGKMKLYDTDGEEYERSTLGQPAFYPTSSSSETDTAPKFTMNQKF